MSALQFWLLCFIVCLCGAPSPTSQEEGGAPSDTNKTPGGVQSVTSQTPAAGTSIINQLPVYYLVNETRTWTDAKSHCEQNCTDLAVIYNQGDWQRVLAAVRSSTSEVWIGLHRDPEWKWSNGEDFMYFNWDAGWGPTSGYDCAYVFSGKWQTMDCRGSNTYMCQKVINTGGIFIKTYEYSKSVSATWDNARTSCISENGELASITNKQDQQKFDKIAPSGTNIWIGLEIVNGVWKWSSEEPFQNWATNDSSSTKNCIKLSGDKKWTPEDCSDKNMFLCYTATPTFTTQSTSSCKTTTVTKPTSSASSGTTVSNTPSYSNSDKTYYLVNETRNWTDAKSHCEQNNTDLAVIYNQGDWQRVLAAVESSTSEVWIGLHRDPEWKWSNGEDFMYFNWDAGWGPKSGHDCAFSVSGKWQTTDCGGSNTYMCQKVMNTGGIFIKTYEYKSVSVTWEKARNSCKSENGELASITNKQDQQEFDKIVCTGEHIWIGLTRVNGVWNWSSEEPFQNWATNDSSSTKNCTKLSGDKKWTPEDCSETYLFLCSTRTPTFTTQSNSSCKITSSASSGATVSIRTSHNLTYIDDPKTWIEALEHCRDHRKTLVHIVNSTVQEYITQMLQNKTYPNGVWIGLERNILFPCATWMWTGGPYVNYSEWHSSFPVDPTCQYCGKLVGNGSKWLDSYCSEELPFICQD
ncbi:hypothetical protein MHYP_G00171160 [Metynnis hypsauchen]